MKLLKFPLIGLCLTGLLFTSCSDDDDNGNDPTPKSSQVYVSSNTSGQVSRYDFEDENNTNMESYAVDYADADGITYDGSADIFYQNDRTNGQLKGYTNFSSNTDGATLTANLVSASTGLGFENARDIARGNGKVVVAQDADAVNGDINAFFIYTANSSAITLDKVFITTINLWGIDLNGNDLYAIQDNSDTLAFYNNFLTLQATALLAPDMKVHIEGITRTHGLKYDSGSDVMILTDVGDGTVDNDGAIHVITDFSSKMNAAGNNGTIVLSDQVRIAGSNTNLGNPVDVDYDADTKLIYVAERANGGGRLLVFNSVTSSGNATPIFDQSVAGASSVSLNN